jgi:hypothetical protein
MTKEEFEAQQKAHFYSSFKIIDLPYGDGSDENPYRITEENK